MSTRGGDVGPVAYLVSSYPSLSHAFIENEVESLRAQGVQVHTFTVRPAPAETQLSPRSRAEAATTTTLLGSPARDWARAGLRTVRTGLPGLVRTAARAARSGPATARSRTWQAFYLAEALLLFDTLRERGIRHVHVHFANNGADVARLVVTLGLAVEGPDSGWRWTMTMHGPTEFEAVEAFDLPAKVRSAHAVACISDFCRGQLMRHSPPQEWDKLHLVRMAVDVERFADAGAERLRRAGEGLRVLFVGRLVPEKGPSVLVAAIDLLRRRRPDVPLDVRIVGRGPLHDDLGRQIADRGLQDHVTLVGPVANEDLPALHAWSDVFCLPSFAEGVPVVLMEAMATGAPVVTTPVAGIPELVRDGVSGRLVPPGRADLLADALAALADAGAAGRARLGAAGREHVRSEFSPQLNAHRLLEVLSR
ncbi:glycosyltransferase family 4 protein [Kineococcus sp. TBRC 1896]|uniref:Glycosyltransferase family 4 protein n=1 Tax=Kineococcus mangrovi TaxID=1660183 RepID=A0ABV4HXW4_9ACTN